MFTAVSERQKKEGSGKGASLSMAVLRGDPGERALLLGTLKYILMKALKTDISVHRGPTGEPRGKARLTGEFERQ